MSKLATWVGVVSGAKGPRKSGGTEFSSTEAMASYLRAHPKADASKHSVAAATAATPPGPAAASKSPSTGPSAVAADTATSKAIEKGTPAAHKEAAAAHKKAADTALTIGDMPAARYHNAKMADHKTAAKAPAAAPAAKPAAAPAAKPSATNPLPTTRPSDPKMASVNARLATEEANNANTHDSHRDARDAHKHAMERAFDTGDHNTASFHRVKVEDHERARQKTLASGTPVPRY